MKVGVKIYNDFQLKSLAENHAVDALYFGDEFCFYRLPEPNKAIEWAKIATENGKQIYFALPVVQQSHLSEVTNLCEAIIDCSKEHIFILNDFGLLYYFKLFLGRMLSRSMANCPWYDHITRNESNFIRKTSLNNSLSSFDLVTFLKDYGVCGVETSDLPGQQSSLEDMMSFGFEIAIDVDTIYVSSSRICATAHHNRIKPPNCRKICDQSFQLNLCRVKNAFDLQNSYIENEQATNSMGDLLVWGNSVFKKNKAAIDGSFCSTMFYDMRWHSNEELEKELKASSVR